MVAVVLLVAMTTGLPGSQALTTHFHPAGCHSQESTAPATPSPSDTSYQCCVNGHHAAIPNTSFTWRPLATRLRSFDDDAEFRSDHALYRNSATIVLPSISPPDTASLRI